APPQPLTLDNPALTAAVTTAGAPANTATASALPPTAPAMAAPTAAPAGAASLPVDPIAAPLLPDLPPQPLYIQVGAFGDATNADRAVQRLQAAGIGNTFILPLTSNGQNLRRIRIGPIASVADFDALVKRLATLGFPQARLAQD